MNLGSYYWQNNSILLPTTIRKPNLNLTTSGIQGANDPEDAMLR